MAGAGDLWKATTGSVLGAFCHLNSEGPPSECPAEAGGLDRLIVDEDSVGDSAVRWSIVGPDGQEAVIYQPYP